MGKGKGKKGKKEEKVKARAAKKDKLTGLPKALKPPKKEKIKKPKKENTNPPGPANYPIPMGRPKPFTKSPQHAKWPALFKKHLGVIEAHIRSLDRVMQSMKSEMGQMDEKEKLEWELGEKGNWRLICQMMDRAREVLASAREAAKGILPARSLKDKKGLGVAGTNFEPLGPKLAERAAALGMDKKVDGGPAKDTDADADNEGDTEMSDASDLSDFSSTSSSSDSESDEAIEKSFVPLPVDNKKKRKASESSGSDKSKENDVEPNPFFVVDTNPTPVVLNGNGPEKKKKMTRSHKTSKPANEAKVEETVVEEVLPEPEQSKVDFAVVQAQLQAEVEAGLLKAKQEAVAAEANKEKKDKKKRKRSSEGGAEEVVEKKVKKERSEKKEKKRKVDDSADGEDVAVDEGKKKKRKHKVEV